jgi:hypothetical protein
VLARRDRAAVQIDVDDERVTGAAISVSGASVRRD